MTSCINSEAYNSTCNGRINLVIQQTKLIGIYSEAYFEEEKMI